MHNFLVTWVSASPLPGRLRGENLISAAFCAYPTTMRHHLTNWALNRTTFRTSTTSHRDACQSSTLFRTYLGERPGRWSRPPRASHRTPGSCAKEVTQHDQDKSCRSMSATPKQACCKL